MISKSERSQIKVILQSPHWQTVQRFAELYCEKIRSDPVLRDTQWETVKMAVLNEGQIMGIKKFIQELYVQSQND